MSKMPWAKGRQSCTHTIAVDKDTLELAKKLALDSKVTIKDIIDICLVSYAVKQKETQC